MVNPRRAYALRAQRDADQHYGVATLIRDLQHIHVLVELLKYAVLFTSSYGCSMLVSIYKSAGQFPEIMLKAMHTKSDLFRIHNLGAVAATVAVQALASCKTNPVTSQLAAAMIVAVRRSARCNFRLEVSHNWSELFLKISLELLNQAWNTCTPVPWIAPYDQAGRPVCVWEHHRCSRVFRRECLVKLARIVVEELERPDIRVMPRLCLYAHRFNYSCVDLRSIQF